MANQQDDVPPPPPPPPPLQKASLAELLKPSTSVRGFTGGIFKLKPKHDTPVVEKLSPKSQKLRSDMFIDGNFRKFEELIDGAPDSTLFRCLIEKTELKGNAVRGALQMVQLNQSIKISELTPLQREKIFDNLCKAGSKFK